VVLAGSSAAPLGFSGLRHTSS